MFGPHRSCLNSLVTLNMALAHPHATLVAVYPAFFCFYFPFFFLDFPFFFLFFFFSFSFFIFWFSGLREQFHESLPLSEMPWDENGSCPRARGRGPLLFGLQFPRGKNVYVLGIRVCTRNLCQIVSFQEFPPLFFQRFPSSSKIKQFWTKLIGNP